MKKTHLVFWGFLVLSFICQILYALISWKFGMLIIYCVFSMFFLTAFYKYSVLKETPYKSLIHTNINSDFNEKTTLSTFFKIFLDGFLVIALSIMGIYFFVLELISKVQ